MKTDLFQSCGHCCIFQICWHIECSTFTASSFRIWNSSTGISSPPLALFIVMLPKSHWLLTTRCLALSEWSHHCDYLGHEDLLCIVAVHSCHLFLISSASVRSMLFLSFICTHLCMKCSHGISNFLEEISSLSHSVVFLFFFHWSLRNVFLSLLAILWNSSFGWVYLSFSFLRFTSFLFSAICKAFSDNHFASLCFFLLGMVLITSSGCHTSEKAHVGFNKKNEAQRNNTYCMVMKLHFLWLHIWILSITPLLMRVCVLASLKPLECNDPSGNAIHD